MEAAIMVLGNEKFPRDPNEVWNLAQDFGERGFRTSFVHNFGCETTGRKQS